MQAEFVLGPSLWSGLVTMLAGSTGRCNRKSGDSVTQEDVSLKHSEWYRYPDHKVHGANMGPIWGRHDPGGPHVGPMNFVIWVGVFYFSFNHDINIKSHPLCHHLASFIVGACAISTEPEFLLCVLCICQLSLILINMIGSAFYYICLVNTHVFWN